MHKVNCFWFLAVSFLLLWKCQSPQETRGLEVAVAEATSNSSAKIAITSFEEWFNNPRPLISAHRGGPYPGYPENAIETFQNIIDRTPAIIECDISMTKDSILVLMHDKTLDRTTDGNGDVFDKMYSEIRRLFLVDNEGDTTPFRVPTLEETLVWGKGKALFTLDVKRGVPYEKVIAAIEKHGATSYAAIITYRYQDAKFVHTRNSDITISVSAGDSAALRQITLSGIPSKNLLAFVGTSEPPATHYRKLENMGIKTILGTLGNLDRSALAKGDDKIYLKYIENGANIIATDRPLEVARELERR